MIKFTFKHPPAWGQEGRRQVNRLKRLIIADLQAGLQAMHDSLLLTPVYTGRTLVNYRWSVGNPETTVRAPVKQPKLPGTTSEMSIGSEPRRAAQRAVIQEEFRAVMDAVGRNPFQNIFLTNNTPYFTDVEYGTYKTSEGHTQRTPPGGMVRRGETLLEVNILGLKRTGGGV